jgi:hypothetical protein
MPASAAAVAAWDYGWLLPADEHRGQVTLSRQAGGFTSPWVSSRSRERAAVSRYRRPPGPALAGSLRRSLSRPAIRR